MEADFGSDPFAFDVGRVGRVIAAAAAPELGAEVGGLDLVEVMEFSPGLVAYCAGNVDF